MWFPGFPFLFHESKAMWHFLSPLPFLPVMFLLTALTWIIDVLLSLTETGSQTDGGSSASCSVSISISICPEAHPNTSLPALHLTWQTPASHRPQAPHFTLPAPRCPSPSLSWGRGAEFGRRGWSGLCLGICPALCQPNAPELTQRKNTSVEVINPLFD